MAANRSSIARIPTLDGIRAFAIVLVLAGHVLGSPPLPDVPPLRHLGDFGVRIFFVLSGFLITTLLLREHAQTGTISLRAFFTRRVFRIFPAFFVFVGAMAILSALGAIDLPASDLVFAATYTMNFTTPESWWVGHLWSLAVEEQFYLLWPLAMMVVGKRRWVPTACIAVVLAPLVRAIAPRVLGPIGDVADHGFPFVFDSLAVGCLLALLRPRLEASPTYLAALRSPLFYPALLGVATAAVITARSPGASSIVASVMNVGVAMAIHRCVRAPASATGRVLEARPMVWLGGLSYSLYLWQQLFCNRLYHAWWTSFPVDLVLAFACAMASYYLVERPVLRWRANQASSRQALWPSPVQSS